MIWGVLFEEAENPRDDFQNEEDFVDTYLWMGRVSLEREGLVEKNSDFAYMKWWYDPFKGWWCVRAAYDVEAP